MHVEERVPTLEGRAVTLRPLTMGDAQVLLAVTPRETFRHFLAWPTSWDLPAFRVWMEKHLFKADQMPFAVVLHDDGTIVGSTSYMDVQPEHRHVEIGCTWYTPAVRGTVVNPECKLLLLRHAFEVMGCARVTLKCDGRNQVSQRAIAKLGAVREGTLRQHRIQPDGFIRDTVYFGIVADEWPGVREKLEARVRAKGV